MKKTLLTNKAYDILKWVAILFLPAVATLYSRLAAVWGWSYGTELVETLAAIQIFLGAILGVSTIQYNNQDEESEEQQDVVD